MPMHVFQEYTSAIEIIKASEALEQLSFHSHVHKKESDRKQVVDKMMRILSPYQKKKTMEELELELRMKGLMR